MTSQQELRQTIARYLELFPEEREGLDRFIRFVEQFDGPSLYDRKNFTGHITASGMVYDPSTDRLLLLEHVQLKKWLQPGGHVEASDASILTAALREVEEETGIRPSLLTLQGIGPDRFPVIDLDCHPIPLSETKREAAHWHLDVRYLFTLPDTSCELHIDPTESKACKWMKVDDIPSHFGFVRLGAKIRRAMAGF